MKTYLISTCQSTHKHTKRLHSYRNAYRTNLFCRSVTKIKNVIPVNVMFKDLHISHRELYKKNIESKQKAYMN